MTVSAFVPVSGGLVLLAALVFQIALGKRWIKLGKLHMKVHRWVAYAMLAFAVLHGVAGLAYAGLFGLP